MPGAWTVSGACTSGSTGRRKDGTRGEAPTTRSTGSGATTSTTHRSFPDRTVVVAGLEGTPWARPARRGLDRARLLPDRASPAGRRRGPPAGAHAAVLGRAGWTG